MDTIKKTFGKRLAELRKKRGFSQELFSELIGISQRNLSKHETGKSFHRRCFAEILKVLNISAKDFFDWEHLILTDEEKREFLKKVIDELPSEFLNLCFRIANIWKS